MSHYYFLNTILANGNLNLTTKDVEESRNDFTTSFQSNRIKFWILLSLQLISTPCFLFLFYRFAKKRQKHQAIHNHAVILLLINSFLFVIITLSLTLAYMYTSHVYPASKTFCTLWNWFHYSINIINLFLIAFASMERNWLIFHPNSVKNVGRRFLFHYCPLTFCVIYPPVFFAAAMFIHRCTSYYDYTQLLCKWPCYFYNERWANVDLFFNNYTPLFSIPIFCAVLYIRLFIQRRHMRQRRFQWRRDKRLVLQIWALSSLYLAMWMPVQLAGLINLYWLPTFLLQAQIDYMYLFPYLIPIVYPFIVLMSSPHDVIKSRRQTATVNPMHPLRITYYKQTAPGGITIAK